MGSPAAGQDCWTIGRWRFDAPRGTLSDGAEVRRLEHRAAQTLAILCHRRGEIVARDELLREVWRGRAVSSNSVAVVIADLRRAMDDDAKAPALLETVAKRGYRLLPDSAPEVIPPNAPQRHRRPTLELLGGAALVLLIMLAVLGRPSRPVTVRLHVGTVRNETGRVGDAALATALGELLVDRLARDDALTVVEGTPATMAGRQAPELTLTAKLVLWNSLPTLHMAVTERRTGRVVWSGMAVADADHIAAETINRLAELERELRSRRARML